MKRTIVNPIIKDSVTFLQTSEESGGKVSEAEITLMPEGGNPLHYHKTYSETFTAIEGELGIKLGKNKTKILRPGESHTVEPMSLHSFYNPSQKEIRFNVKLQPGHTGFENSLRILYGLAAIEIMIVRGKMLNAWPSMMVLVICNGTNKKMGINTNHDG